MNNYEQIKQEYNNVKPFKEKFDLEYKKVLEKENIGLEYFLRARALKVEIEGKMAELFEKLNPFIPERDIAKEDWDKMKKKLEQYRQNADWGNFSSQAMHMKILSSSEIKISPQGCLEVK